MNITIKQRSLKIKAMLVENDIPLKSIAAILLVTSGQVTNCLAVDNCRWRRNDPYVREWIARRLGVPYKELWGEDKPKLNSMCC